MRRQPLNGIIVSIEPNQKQQERGMHMHHIVARHHQLKFNGKIDTLALIVGVIQPLTTLPQIFIVFSSRDVSQVSLFMWTSYNIASVVLLIYGLKHRLLPVICAQVLWLLVQTLMMAAIFLFA